MKFELNRAIEVLEKTPSILNTFLLGLSDDWLKNNEGENTWSPYDILGHLIFGEKTDWMVRIKIILGESESKLFEPFDRFAQLKEDQSKPISQLLVEFEELRKTNLDELKSFNIVDKDLARIGVHPELGEVNLKQIISTWALHDLGHIAQIARVMAKQYKTHVGPWLEYLGILKN